jgi:hypothetical protein
LWLPGKGGTVLVNIQHHVIAQISGGIYGVAGYYEQHDEYPDNDGTQHVVVATTDGTLYEIHWNQYTAVTSPQRLGQFSEIASLGGFYTPYPDDEFQHVIVATHDGSLQELYFKDPHHVQLHTPSPLFHLNTTLGPGVGMAAFFSSDDGVRHATVGGADNILHEVVWGGQGHVNPSAHDLATQFTMSDVAAIAGFFDLSVHSRDVIVAMEGGNVYDVHYGGAILGGGQPTTDLVTHFSPTLVNVAAFVSTDTNYRHVVVLDASGQVYDYSYTPQHVFGRTWLYALGNVIDMAAYFSVYDRMRHVILATGDGKIHEVYYGQLG